MTTEHPGAPTTNRGRRSWRGLRGGLAVTAAPELPHTPRRLDSITDVAGYASFSRSCHPMRELRSHLGRHQPTPFDAEAEKCAGWREHGILVVAQQDPHLSWPEREIVRRLGEKLYGQRPEDSG